MKWLSIAFVLLVPGLAWGHGGGLDKYGCHHDTKKGDYHCHQGSLKGRAFKSQDTMLAAHPELRGGASVGQQCGAADECGLHAQLVSECGRGGDGGADDPDS